MVQTLSAKDIDLAQLETLFGLVQTHDPNFFPEWQDTLPDLSASEGEAVDEVKAEYLHLSRYNILEPLVKMVVLSPLLKLAGFYRPPFYVMAEQQVELTTQDEGQVIRGLVDVLVFHEQVWIITIEAKRAEYSLKAAIPQVLFYMLGQPLPEHPIYGFMTNGSEFKFLKLQQRECPTYELSYTLALDRGDDLNRVVRILKRFAQLAIHKQ
ncbi:MAG: type I restriction enzyme HsdR N-terminal domain-containing protein [Cyanobacteria bacterium J06639_14]